MAVRDLWKELCSYSNLELAFKKARKHKTLKPCVLEFEADLQCNLSQLRAELLLHCYQPRPLETFILHDPKTRKISKSHFRDRVIHHALCNIIEPLLEPQFIFDSYANRKGKGTLKAVERFDFFQRKASHNYRKTAFVLKADIRHYFDEIDHTTLLYIVQRKIKDPHIMWLIKRILSNYHTQDGKGMPLGNLTSQFFANVYLNELDQFVKHVLNAKYYLRYVDDFVILHSSPETLMLWKKQIADFLDKWLSLHLHPDKTKIIPSERGVDFLGFKLFPYHRLLKRKNMRHFLQKYRMAEERFNHQQMSYDELYDFMEGWCAHSPHADMFKRRIKIIASFEQKYAHEISSKEVNRGRPQSQK